MREILTWWAAVVGLGWLAWPICFRCQVLLPGRGLPAAKVAGLVLWAFLRAWLLYVATAAKWPLGPGAAGWLAAGGVAAVSALTLVRSGRAMLAWTWENRGAALRTEVAFAALFAGGLWLRWLIPDATWDVQWAGAEKWGNLAILTSVWRHAAVPPLDPWLAGYGLNYYYFGHFLWGSLARLTAVAPPVAFNLAMATLMALMALAAWSAGYALSERRSGAWWALFLIVVAGTPLTWSQAPHLARLLLDEGPAAMLRNFDFWGPSSIRDDARYEFPAFNWMLGDLHAHALGQVVLLWALALLAQLRRARDSEGGGGWLRLAWHQAPPLALLAVATACLWATNGWDVPVLGLVALGWVALEAVRTRDWREGLALGGSGLALAALFGVVAMRFLAGFFSKGMVMPLIVLNPDLAKLPPPLNALGSLGVVDAALRSSTDQWLAYWGFLAAPLAWVAVAGAAREKGSWRAALAPNSPLAATGVVVALLCVVGRSSAAADGRPVPPFVAAGLAAALAGVVVALAQGAQRARLTAAGEWGLLLGGVSLFLQFVPEVVYVADPISPSLPRYNTVFKLYYPAWALAALAGALALAEWAAARRRVAEAADLREAAPQGVDPVPADWSPLNGFLEDAGSAAEGPATAVTSGAPAHARPASAEAGPLLRDNVLGRGASDGRNGVPMEPPASRALGGRVAVAAVATVFVALASAYAVLGVGRRVALSLERVRHAVEDQGVAPRQALAACQTLDASAFLALPEYAAGDDRRLALWMRDQWQPSESDGWLLESGNESYTMGGRFAVLSGVPTYLGWSGHETQWRGNAFQETWQVRSGLVRAAYESDDVEAVRNLLRMARIRWVAVGLLERRTFADTPQGLRKFERMGRVVHREGDSVLYEIDWTPGTEATP